MKHKLLAAVAFAVLVLPGVSLAQTQNVASLQAELQSLLAQVKILEAQLAAAGGSTATWCYTFNRNLSIGMNGSDVTALQTALQKDGESVQTNGAFDDQTAAAVTTFQQKYQSTILAPYGLSNGTGYAGKGTRTELNSLFGCNGSNPISPIVVNPIVRTSSLPIACPMFMPYCPYGGHAVMRSDGCSQEVCNSEPVSSLPQQAAPYISQVSPSAAAPGTTVTVTGQNFDANSYISLGNVPTGPENFPVAVTSETPTSLTFTVPSNFATGPQPLYVAEHNSNLVSNQGTLTISAAPYISQLNPTSAAPGALVTITGYNFDSNSYISLGNVPTGPENFPVAVNSQTATSLTFTVPSNFATGPQPLYVAEHNSSLVSNKGTLTISAAPYISQVNPTTAAPGATVTITGQNFDANSYIAIGNAPGKPESQTVTPASYTPTSLTFVVPAYGISVGAGYSNPLYVAETNSNLVSNEASLTVVAQ